MAEAGEGPALVRELSNRWMQETGGTVPGMKWLKDERVFEVVHEWTRARFTSVADTRGEYSSSTLTPWRNESDFSLC
jgi:hypothetical protein